MSDSTTEVKIDKIITEETTKVSDKLENIIETVGIDSALVKPIIDQVTSAATAAATATATATATVIIEVAKEKLGLSMISESSLSEDQKKLAISIYDSVKKAIESFINDPDVNNTIKITKTIGQVIKQLESTKAVGGDKKAVAIQLGRILIKEVTPDDKGEAEILMVYDLIAEQTLEAMIEVSKVVNIAVQEMATKCCPGLLEFFKRAKKTA
jgi:hypothetical protein